MAGPAVALAACSAHCQSSSAQPAAGMAAEVQPAVDRLGAGAAMIVASVAGGGRRGRLHCQIGDLRQHDRFFAGCARRLIRRRGAGGGGMLCSIRAPQFPQKRSSALTSLWQFGHCAIWLPLSSRYLNTKCEPGAARME